MKICRRCGRCCHWEDTDGKLKKCPFLVEFGITTACRIYKDRHHRWIGTRQDGVKIYCHDREDVPTNYPGCPFNRDEWRDLK